MVCVIDASGCKRHQWILHTGLSEGLMKCFVMVFVHVFHWNCLLWIYGKAAYSSGAAFCCENQGYSALRVEITVVKVLGVNAPVFGPTSAFVTLVTARFPSDRLLGNRTLRVLMVTSAWQLSQWSRMLFLCWRTVLETLRKQELAQK